MRSPLQRLRVVAALLVLTLAGAVAMLLLSAASQLREAHLLRLVAGRQAASLSPQRVQDAEHLLNVAVLTSAALVVGSLLLLLALLAVAMPVARHLGSSLSYSTRRTLLSVLVPVYGIVVVSRSMTDVWRTDGYGRARRRIELGWGVWVLASVLRSGALIDATSPRARWLLSASAVAQALCLLGLAAFAVGLVLRLEGRAAAPEPRSAPSRPTRPLLALAAASLVLALVGLTVGSVQAARVPSSVRLSAAESTLPDADPAAPAAAPPAPAGYLLRAPAGFSVRLPATPTVTHDDQKGDSGPIVITTWSTETDVGEAVVQSQVFTFDLDADTLLPTLLEAARKGSGSTASQRSGGVVSGHRFEQAVFTDPQGNRAGVRIIALKRSAILLIGLPVPELATLVATLTVTAA